MKSDANLRAEVEYGLRSEPGLGDQAITVQVDGGVVSLAGYVTHYADRWSAEEVAKRVTGVRAIANEIEVKMPKPGERSDKEIAVAALNALQWHFSLESTDIKVVVKQGWITLSGTVEYGYQRSVAESAVRNLRGVKGLTDNILVVPAVKPAEIKQKIQTAFQRQASLDAKKIKVKVDKSSVALEGSVHSLREKDDAGRAAWAAPGVTRVENLLEVTF